MIVFIMINKTLATCILHNSNNCFSKFRFMYFEAKIINENNVIGALYAAEKYGVSDLVDICRSYLESNIGESTVCVIMENARIFNMANLLSKCINFIFHCEYASKRIFSSPGFLDLSRKCLKALVESDDLILDETFIYRSLIRWARYNCEKEQKDNADLKQLREIMGDLIYDIRFPTMSLEKFWKDIVPDGVLLSEEKIQISEQIIGRCVQNPVFKTSYRNYSKRKICEIFRNTSESTEYSWMPQSNINAIDFEVNKKIGLSGIFLYGNSNAPYTYDVELKIISKTNEDLVHILANVQGTEKMFRINFEDPCQIRPGEKYTIWVKLKGPVTLTGRYIGRVCHNDYIFNFSESHYWPNGTNVQRGQIPGIVCLLNDCCHEKKALKFKLSQMWYVYSKT